jgi:hypothetical protein
MDLPMQCDVPDDKPSCCPPESACGLLMMKNQFVASLRFKLHRAAPKLYVCDGNK